jgi:DNA-binding NtrC family response regulator
MTDHRERSKITVFILDMEHNTRELIRRWLVDEGYFATVFQEAPSCLDAIAEDPPDILLADVLTTSLCGLEIVDKVATLATDVLVILIYPSRLADNALKSVFRGAFDFHSKPLDRTRLSLSVKNAARTRMLETENRRLRSDLSRQHGSMISSYPTEMGLSMKDLERKAIKNALAATKGNVSKAARTLGLGRTTLYRKMSAFGLGGFKSSNASSAEQEAETSQ